MKGLQIFCHSYCRSTLAFYDFLAKDFNLPLRICLGRSGLGHRSEIGFTENEFKHLNIIDVSKSSKACLNAIRERANWYHIFGVYQIMPHIQDAIKFAIEQDYKFAIASEAPSLMTPPSLRRTLKKIYHSFVAKKRFSYVTSNAEFIINWSGDHTDSLEAIGWNSLKIIPCGYYPPPLLESKFTPRNISIQAPFHILCTGAITWHRGQDILIKALILLKKRGVLVRTTFTGKGVLESRLRKIAFEHNLQCEFVGTVPMKKLIDLYQSCSLFVAPGREEPWGIRVNDALNCGTPSIVSRGMGASKLIHDYGFGSTFSSGDYIDLSWKIERFVKEKDYYQFVCNNLKHANNEISPKAAAKRIANVMRQISVNVSK
jgi:glycosyltransferase involved in cell wall biosynthesis